jgi:hypothetical protein
MSLLLAILAGLGLAAGVIFVVMAAGPHPAWWYFPIGIGLLGSTPGSILNLVIHWLRHNPGPWSRQ